MLQPTSVVVERMKGEQTETRLAGFLSIVKLHIDRSLIAFYHLVIQFGSFGGHY
jgi:hypothetical protein